MKTNHLLLFTDWIKTDSSWTWWYKNSQVGYYEERKEGKTHGDFKGWWRDGRLGWHELYENGELVKRIV